MKSKNSYFNLFNIKSMNRFFVLLMISFSLAVFVSCGSDSSTSVTNPPDNDDEPMNEQGPDEVWMEGNTFNVSNLEVTAGTTVTWTNQSNANHTVTSGTRGGDDEGDLFDSGSIAPGGTFTHTFDAAGSYAYFCAFHPGMDAEVTVSE